MESMSSYTRQSRRGMPKPDLMKTASSRDHAIPVTVVAGLVEL
jgi:hypothetical protein